MNKRSIISLCFTILVLFGRLSSFIATPLWLDYFKNFNKTNTTYNGSTKPTDYEVRQALPWFAYFVQGAVPAIVWFVVLIWVIQCFPKTLGSKDRTYPPKSFWISGLSLSLSATLVNYSLSGTRTPTYLQAVLSNFGIPIHFLVRFLILRRRPTVAKAVCALVVVLAEFVCLLPKIFPWLEPGSQQSEDGGATGAGAVLWPLCFVLAMVPFTATNALMEGSVKDKSEDSSGQQKHINIIYYLFWFEFSLAFGSALFFWVDFVPGFGTSRNIHVFWEKFVFNVECCIGQAGCGPEVVVLFWITILANLLAVFSIAYLLRYSEGANYMMVVMTLRSPLLLLFWTLFDESPFTWHPHVHLSTWLSIAALAIMIPAVVVYNISSPEKVSSQTELTTDIANPSDSDRQHLLPDTEHSESVDKLDTYHSIQR